MNVKGYFFGCLSSATYGLIPLFALPILRNSVGLDSLLSYRFSCAALLLALVMLIKKESFSITRKQLIPLITLGILFSLSAQFLFWSYSYLSVGMASTILFIYPIFVAIIMGIFFKERISKLSQLAIFIALCGVIMLYEGDTGTTINPLGVVIILLSALMYALYLVVINKSSVHEISGYKITFYALAFSAIFFVVKAQFTGGLQTLPDNNSIFNLVMLATFGTVVSCVAMAYSVQYIGSTTTAILGALEPVTAVAIGVFVFRESLTLNLSMGIVLILTAVSLIVLSDQITHNLKVIFKHRPRLGNR